MTRHDADDAEAHLLARWLRLPVVRVRQLADRIRHRLLFVPLAFAATAVVLSQMTLWLDRFLGDEPLPFILETTVDSGRAVLSAIAAGLISSITLLLSLMLVAVQLTSTQFSPRSLRDWIGDDVQKRTIGVVLGTTVYCLLVLRQTRTVAEGDPLTPNISVLLALGGGVLSLIAVVRSVDHLTNSLRIGQVAGSLAAATVAIVEQRSSTVPVDHDEPVAVDSGSTASEPQPRPPPDAEPVTATGSGWVQQIDEQAMLAVVEDHATVYVTTAIGRFTLPGAPLVWIHPAPNDERRLDEVRATIAIGDTRTMLQDVGFGIVQLVDIALRALSPGVNDPGTAVDVIDHLGVVLLALWEQPPLPTTRVQETRRLVTRPEAHGDHLHHAFDQLRRYGCHDAVVASAMLRTLANLRAEVVRRGLPGPLAPIDDVVREVALAVSSSELSDDDQARVLALLPMT